MLQKNFIKEFSSARNDLTELIGGGQDIRGPFPVEDSRYPLYHTLVQMDGDVCLIIHPDALDLGSFENDVGIHIKHVEEKLRSMNKAQTLIRQLNKWFSALFLVYVAIKCLLSANLYVTITEDLSVKVAAVATVTSFFMQNLIARVSFFFLNKGIKRFL